MTYICSVCGAANCAAPNGWHRELVPCSSCGSNARFRAIACALTEALLGQAAVLGRIDRISSVRGIGISDADCYASVLARKFNYVNTFLHAEPRVDIEDPASLAAHAPLHFIVCSDVIEHTIRPPSVVLPHLHDALLPGGVLVISAPTYEMPDSVERYPTLAGYEVELFEGLHRVRYRTAFGTEAFDDNPVFHGGPGRVLELRVLSHAALLADLRRSGLVVSSVSQDALVRHGAMWPSLVERSDLPYPMNGAVHIARRAAG